MSKNLIRYQEIMRAHDAFADVFNALAEKLESVGVDSGELVVVVNALQELERMKVLQ